MSCAPESESALMPTTSKWIARIAVASALVVAAAASPMLAEAPGAAKSATKEAAADAAKPAGPAERLEETSHTLRLGGATIAYRALAGEMVIRDREEKPTAKIFYVAYLAKSDAGAAHRPLTFVFNGGPGASAAWLHLGAFGPKRLRLAEDGSPVGPPFGLTDNPATLLDLTDLVFVDPVSTGYSRTVEGQKADPFLEVHGDVESMGEFIRLFATRQNRWGSPIFLAGESYGTIRAAGLVDYLARRFSLYCNGVVLLSEALNEATFQNQPGNDLPYLVGLPSLAAVAWYHKKLEPGLESLTLDQVIAQASDFALGPYADALLRGAALPDAKRREVVSQLARFTSLSSDEIERRDLRIDSQSFTQLLLQPERRQIGLLDGRFSGFLNAPPAETFGPQYLYPVFDPFYAQVAGAFAAGLQQLLRDDLGFTADERYETLALPVAGAWDYSRVTNRYLYAADNLRAALTSNPKLRVFVANGDFDLVTTHLAAEYVIDHLGLDPRLRGNLTLAHYPAGHMMYLHEPSLRKLKRDLESFYRTAAP